MQTTARAGCWPWGLGDARVGHTVMTPEQRSRCDGAARCPPCPVGAPKRLSALALTLSGAGTATVIWGKIEADAERMASRACHNGPASARCGPRRRGRRDWAGQRSGFVGPPGTAPRRPRPRPCCCCSCCCRNGATYEVGVLQQLAGRQVLVLGRLVGVLAAAGGQAGGAPRQLALLQKLHVALVQAVQGAPANAPVEVVHALALQSHRRPLYSAPRPAHAVPLGRSWPGEGLCPFDPQAHASLGTT